MVSVSVSIDLETIQRVQEYNTKEQLTSLSAGISKLTKLGLAYTALMDEQDKHQTKLGGT
jgi:hypothetical protein